MELPFTEQEQRFLLAEVIKTSSIPPEKLLAILNESNVSPNWMLMQVPQGRNLASCIHTFDSIAGRTYNSLTPQLPSASLFSSDSPGFQNKRRSVSDLELTAPDSSRKRRTPGLDVASIQRNIQPKPAANGSSNSVSPQFAGQIPKKRGRPSKTDLKIRQAEEIARGERIDSLATSKGPIESPIASGGDITLKSILSSAPIATLAQKSELSAVNSTGDKMDSSRKRRGRPTSRSSNVPRTGEGSFPILPAQFPQQIQTPPRFGIHQTFDRSMRAQFQPESREAQITRDNQGQGTQFNAQSNVEGRQMHASGQANNKEQQEMQYKGTDMVGNPKDN
ncbi:hypothetical protein BCON_0070g00050 [Botryotinia convoluta]|uniref:Uncharacterized protein n=1 Tax=Botryotinia convoluta TaxID=54673 RepID=A0A4Z1IK20_9HELO|nr:hypothetical protein BCON_0070g00050 [Botryotinia convoluta]